MDSLYKKLDESFGALGNQDVPLFYHADEGIRFALSDLGEGIDDGSATECFYRALYRSSELLSFIFEQRKFYVDFRFSVPNKTVEKKEIFKDLAACGFNWEVLKFDVGGVKYIEDEECYQHRFSYLSNACGADTHALLWAVCSEDLPIAPPYRDRSKRIIPEVYFIDMDRKIMFHPYDDRGADLVSLDKETIRPAYDKFHDWILDYDRETIIEKFGKPNK